MTINFHSELQRYDSELVNLSNTTRDALYARREANRNRLRKNLPQRIQIYDFIAQGSMAIRTAIQETNYDYDIDDGVVFHATSLKGAYLGILYMTAEEVRDMVAEALQDKAFDKKPVVHGNCVRVFYAEGYHVDVPAFRIWNPGTDEEKQELAGKDGWRQSNPTAINFWFESRVQRLNRLQEEAGGQFRRMIRLLKRYSKSRGATGKMPSGLKLTMLADECFERSAERDDKAFYFLLENLQRRLKRSLVVKNLAQKEEERDSLTKSEHDESMIRLRDKVDEALQLMAPLWESKCLKRNATAIWDWVFQAEGFFRT